ncbi:S66 peptidase family protein [Aquimarina brevivitae]|uniref:Muramoyltetrapeptide carboxypeptidase n=1 Tax=Aquimarina brevivitae TaxID=323412 RepID=A0A4Q7PF41_9FLAO|nr:LD-carboxypeptidase [Aquimarina brevivitae]RZS99064.1 muramoyltetrapeptide carboxypeptidase [Aquimarina brevivitae]
MLKPTFLTKGDKIGIVSTARKVSSKEIKASLKLIASWGLVPILGKTIDKEYHQFAGTDNERSADFQSMIDNDEIAAVWCARGGYGTVRVIDEIDFSKFKQQPKWIIGYSDITVLHTHIHNLGVATMHAPMPIDLHKCLPSAIEGFKNSIFGTPKKLVFKGYTGNRQGHMQGELIGGNLSMLYSLCGSASAIETTNKIICIEDLDEYLYHVDRMAQNLKRNAFFENIAGLLIGGMTKMHDNTVPFGKDALQIIAEIVSDYNFPVAFNCPFGHVKNNQTLLFGTEVAVQVGETVTLNYL